MELLIVIIIIAVLAAIAIPKFANSSNRSKDSSLRANLKVVRNAVELFKNDTGYYPKLITDLSVTTAPAQGYDSAGNLKAITASDFKGPYMLSVPNDPVSGAAFTYSITSPTVGNVSASATGNDSTGTAYTTY